MDPIDELLESVRTLYASLEKLRQLEGSAFVLPRSVGAYHSVLEDAYAAYGKIETMVDELGQQLEAEHTRLDKVVNSVKSGRFLRRRVSSTPIGSESSRSTSECLHVIVVNSGRRFDE